MAARVRSCTRDVKGIQCINWSGRLATYRERFPTVAPSGSMGDTASLLGRRGGEGSGALWSNMQRGRLCARMHVRRGGESKERLGCVVSRADPQRRRRFTRKPIKLQRHSQTVSRGTESAVMGDISEQGYIHSRIRHVRP